MHHPAFASIANTPIRGTHGARLDGWSIPIKSSTPVVGLPTIDGSPHRTSTPTDHDPFVAWLLRQGASVPATTLSSELGATCYAERPDMPVLESPAYPGCTPGGSSTGAGVAVALGLSRAAHGTDAGGSIRVPAAACNVVGFKLGGKSLSAHGMLTTTVKDQMEIFGWTPPPPRRLRIGVLTRGIFADPQVQSWRLDAVDEAAGALDRYHEVVAIDPYPESRETYRHFGTIIKSSFTNAEPLDSDYISWLHEEALALSPEARANASTHVGVLPELLARNWDVDVVLCPTLAFDPPKLGTFSDMSPEDSFEAQTGWSPWCSVFNMLKTPAIALGPVHLGALNVTGAELLELAALLRD